MADTNPTAKLPGLVVAFSGPKEGVGKSSVCLNLALAWAGSAANPRRDRPVLVVSLDPLCRSEHSFFLNLQPPTAVELAQWIKGDPKNTAGLAKLVRGKIPLSPWNVGALPLAKKRSEAAKLHPEVLLPVLASLSESYDLFLDVDPFFPMQIMAFDLADITFWVTLPHYSHLQASVNTFQEIKELHFPLERFEVVVNQADIPGAVEAKELERVFGSLNRRILSHLPWEDFLMQHQNEQKIVVVEKGASEWVKSLRPLLGRVAETKPGEKDWTLSVPSSEFGWGGGRPEGDAGRPAAAAAAAGQAGKSAGSKDEWHALKERIHKKVVAALETERIRIGDDAATNPETRKKVETIGEEVLSKEPNLALSRDQRTKFVAELLDEILGLGPLEEIMRNPGISEIMVNGADHVYIEQSGRLVLTDYKFRDDEQVIGVIKRIVAPYNRRIDESVPLVDCRLKDGSRVNAIIPPLAVSGPTITIRRFSSRPLQADDLVKKGSFSADVIAFLQACVKVRKNIIISGGTGTGKTTFLNMLSNYIPDGERIITVEDTAELKLLKEHWVRLESRPANIEGKGEVNIRDLVKNCLRMRPDRIVVGECRGAEAMDMLQAMNTGHEGSLATIHANTPKDALGRLEAMCLMAGAELPIWALREMICSAVHMFVQLTRFSDGTRKVTYITEVTGREETTITTHDLFLFKQTGVSPEGKVLGDFRATGDPPKFYHEFHENGIEVPLDTFLTPEKKAAARGRAA